MRHERFVIVMLCWAVAWATSSFAAPTSAPSTQPVMIEQPTAGWRLTFPAGWQPPKPYEGKDLSDHWDQQGVGHRVPPGSDTNVMLSPMLVWWGDEIRAEQTMSEVATIMAGHHGMAEKITLGEVTDVEVAKAAAKRVEVTFVRSIPFGPPGKSQGAMRAVMYLIRHQGQENGLWFETPAADFEKVQPLLAPVLRDAQIIKRALKN
jgi:hypothetical protein